MPQAIGKLVKSNAHTDYVCQVYGPGETETVPTPTDYALGSFVRIALRAEPKTWLVGLIYDTFLSATEIADLFAEGGGGGGLSGTFLDEFNAIAYNGNDGTLDWSNDWQETGESDGPGGGDFHVVNNSWCASGNCLQIREDRASTRRLSREVDLTGAASATLSLNYRRRHVSSPIGGTITLEASRDGVIFAPLKTYEMSTQDSGQQSDSFDISAYIASNTQIRFSTSNVLYETALYVDNVLIDTTGGGGGGGGGPTSTCAADDFETDDYSGNTGDFNWNDNWVEVNESTNPNNGDEQVVILDGGNHVARVRDNDSGGEGILRSVDLSTFTSATLNFNYWRSGLDNSNDYASVQVWPNASDEWEEVLRIEGPGTDDAGSPQSASHDISAFIMNDTHIRFITSPNMGSSDSVYFDNIEVCGQ